MVRLKFPTSPFSLWFDVLRLLRPQLPGLLQLELAKLPRSQPRLSGDFYFETFVLFTDYTFDTRCREASNEDSSNECVLPYCNIILSLTIFTQRGGYAPSCYPTQEASSCNLFRLSLLEHASTGPTKRLLPCDLARGDCPCRLALEIPQSRSHCTSNFIVCTSLADIFLCTVQRSARKLRESFFLSSPSLVRLGLNICFPRMFERSPTQLESDSDENIFA
jgi:hypothetical protein